MKTKVWVECYGYEGHQYDNVPLIATTDHPRASYGLPVVLAPDGQPIGPDDLLDSNYGLIPLGQIDVVYGDGFSYLSEEDRRRWRKKLFAAGYSLAVSPLDNYCGRS